MVSTSTFAAETGHNCNICEQEIASCDASPCDKTRLKSGQVHEYVQSIRGQCVQTLDRLATDVGQNCCGNPRTVLNDVALSDPHR